MPSLPNSPADKLESHILHFALGHLGGGLEFELRAGRLRYPLMEHNSETRSAYCAKNAALRQLPSGHLATLTHYVERALLPAKCTTILRVVSQTKTAKGRLPMLAALGIHVPLQARRAHSARRSLIPHIPLFDYLDLPQPAASEAPEISLAAADVFTPPSTAAALVFQHPQLATVNPATATIVIDEHIQSRDNAINIARFGATIASQGSGWSTSGDSTDYAGNALTWGPFFSQSGQPVQTYQLSPKTLAAAGASLALPLATTQNDPLLRDASWSSRQGIGSVNHDTTATAQTMRLRRRPIAHAFGFGDASSDFTVNNLTPGYGLDIDDSSLVFVPDGSNQGAGQLSINVMNSYLRSLWAFAQFYDPGGNPIGTWNSLDLVSPVNVVLGIPADTDPTTLTLDWPAEASNAILAHGGLGTSNWDNDIVWNGVILTGIFNYGIPILFLIVGSELDSNAWLKEIEEDSPTLVAIFKDAVSILGSLTTNSIGFPNIKTIFSAFADGIAGLLVHAGLEKLQAYVVEQLGEAALEDAIPYVDFIFEIANRAVDLAEIGETTVEVLESPAVYNVSILRSMPLDVTVTPDPTHGSLGNPAIWPLDSDHYQCIAQYQGSTAYTANGPMLGANSSQPIQVNYTSVPEGGQLQVQFSVYSVQNTLLGRWTSGWVNALRPQPGATLSLTGAIQETLVPLSSTTLYNYKEKLIYNQATSAHAWQANAFSMAPSTVTSLDVSVIEATIATAFQNNASALSSSAVVSVITLGRAWKIVDGPSVYLLNYSSNAGGEVVVTTNNTSLAVLPLNQNDVGNNLGATVGLTMNNRAYMLGYCWRASGQNVPAYGTTEPVITTQISTFQNINVLANPEASLKFSGVGFANQPFLVYDQFGPVPLFSVSSSFVSSLESGNLDLGLVTLFSQFSYPLPASGVAVATVTADAQWTIAVNSIPTYSLFAGAGQINVYPYPAVVISPNNFYLQPTSTDPTDYQYQLRKIVLDNTTPFDMNQTRSWGLFLLPHLNDVVVHPQGYVVGAHFNLNMLEILQLPVQSSPDDQAIPAVFVGGNGTRPGLFGGPVALAVTADGRILVLEQTNQRIQAIDVNGNPVPSFTAAVLPGLSSDCATSLDNGLVSTEVRAAFLSANQPLSTIWRVQDATAIYQLAASASVVAVTLGGSGLSTSWTITDSSSPAQIFSGTLSATEVSISQGSSTPLFSVDPSVASSLNSGTLGTLLSAAFAANSITLAAPISVVGNNPLSLDISVVNDLAQGLVPGSLTSGLAACNITLGTPASVTASVRVTVAQSTALWQLADQITGATFQLTLPTGSNQISVTELASTMALNAPPAGAALTYLSMATETKGYIYVLSYVQPGTDIFNFLLDIYNPDGTPLATTSGLNAGDIVVDMWRNLYSLNFESFLGPNGATEPSISVWTPSA